MPQLQFDVLGYANRLMSEIATAANSFKHKNYARNGQYHLFDMDIYKGAVRQTMKFIDHFEELILDNTHKTRVNCVIKPYIPAFDTWGKVICGYIKFRRAGSEWQWAEGDLTKRLLRLLEYLACLFSAIVRWMRLSRYRWFELNFLCFC